MTALVTERETLASLRGKLAAARRNLDNAVATTARLGESRARHRNLVVRIKAAALLGSQPHEDRARSEHALAATQQRLSAAPGPRRTERAKRRDTAVREAAARRRADSAALLVRDLSLNLMTGAQTCILCKLREHFS